MRYPHSSKKGRDELAKAGALGVLSPDNFSNPFFGLGTFDRNLSKLDGAEGL
jgi:hypothetical protein